MKRPLGQHPLKRETHGQSMQRRAVAVSCVLVVLLAAASCVGSFHGVVFNGAVTEVRAPGRMCMNVGPSNKPALICGGLPNGYAFWLRLRVGRCVIATWVASKPKDTGHFNRTEGTFSKPIRPC